MTVYNYKPRSKLEKQGYVLSIKTNTNIEETVRVAEEIESRIFGNTRKTKYEVIIQ